MGAASGPGAPLPQRPTVRLRHPLEVLAGTQGPVIPGLYLPLFPMVAGVTSRNGQLGAEGLWRPGQQHRKVMEKS